MYAGQSVGVVVPTYNEEGAVGRVIDTMPAFVDRVYVVDDGSTDDSWAEIRAHARANNQHAAAGEKPRRRRVVPIRHDRNRGVGGAIKTGYRAALRDGVDVTAVMGGDGQMNPEALDRYLDPIVDGQVGYTKGNRFLRPDDLPAMPRFRLAGNRMLSLLTKIASGYWGLADSQNGYTAISRETLQRVDLEGLYEYYGYCNDLLVRLNVVDARVADVDTSARDVYGDDWASHIRYGEYIPRVAWLLLRRFLWRLWHKHLLGDRHPLAVAYLGGLGGLVLGTLAVVGALVLGRPVQPGLAVVGGGGLSFALGGWLDRRRHRSLAVTIHSEPWSRDRHAERPTTTSQ